MNPEKTTRQKILTNKFIPLLLMALNLSFFFYIIPIHIAEEFEIFFAILGGAITLVLSFWIFLFVTPKLFDKIPIILGLFSISTLFIFGFYFIMRTSHFATNELVLHRTPTEALIVNKTKIYGKRGTTIQYINVQFMTTTKEEATAKINVPENSDTTFYEKSKVKNFEKVDSIKVKVQTDSIKKIVEESANKLVNPKIF